mmetsp:Transcript_16336/g.24182  ORF Transcript_16336/g.24182 Transcript_16336/m.24182 type:complete len:87 (+) Transcript_16336:1071-1331(+)
MKHLIRNFSKELLDGGKLSDGDLIEFVDNVSLNDITELAHGEDRLLLDKEIHIPTFDNPADPDSDDTVFWQTIRPFEVKSYCRSTD